MQDDFLLVCHYKCTIFELVDVQNIVTLKYWLGVIEGMAPFDRSHTRSYSSSILTMAVLYHFQNKARYWSENANFAYPLVFNLDDSLESRRIFAQNFNANCLSPRAIRLCRTIAEQFKSLPRVRKRYRQTTDGRAISRT